MRTAEERRTSPTTVPVRIGPILIALPASSIGLPPAQIDVSAALEADALQFENARRAAERAAERARQLGLEAARLVAADDPETSVAETLLRLAKERDADRPVLLVHERGAVR